MKKIYFLFRSYIDSRQIIFESLNQRILYILNMWEEIIVPGRFRYQPCELTTGERILFLFIYKILNSVAALIRGVTI